MLQLILLGILLILVIAVIWMPPAPSAGPVDVETTPRTDGFSGSLPAFPRRVAIGLGIVAILAGAVLAVVARRPAPDRPPLLVVVPFESIGDQEPYMAAGFTDELTTRLAGVSGLRVASRSLIQGVLQSGDALQDLGVDYLLEGSVSVEGEGDGERLRVRARLVDGTTLTQVWAEVFDEPVERVFAVGGRIAERVAGAMDVALVGTERSVIERPRTENFEAYQAFLEGVTYRRGIRELDNGFAALEAFRRAATLDPGFAAAWGGQAGTHAWLSYWHGFGQHSDSARAKAAYAATLDPDDLDVRMAQAMIAWALDVDFETALETYLDLERSIDPLRLPVVQSNAGSVYAREGRLEEAVAVQRQAVLEDPVLSQLTVQLADFLIMRRDYAEAGPLLSRAAAPRARDARISRFVALLPLLREGDVRASDAALGQLDEVAQWDALAAGLRPDARSLARIHAARLIGLGSGPTGSRGSPAVQAGELLALALAEAQLGMPAGFVGAAEALEAVSRDETLAPGYRVRVLGALAVALAGAGEAERAEAVLGDLGRTMPDDALMQLDFLFASAEARLLSGNVAGAAEDVAELLGRPSVLSRGLLEADPIFRPLVDDGALSAVLP